MNLIKESYLSVTDFEFYRTIVRQPIWRSLIYFTFWVTVGAVFTAVVFSIRSYPKFAETGNWIVRNLPPMEVKHGKLSASIPETPYRISRHDPELQIIVDPTDSVRQSRTGDGVEVIFNSDRIYFRVQDVERSYMFARSDNFRLDRQALETNLKLLRILSVPLSIVLFWPVHWLVKGLQIPFLIVCGLLLRGPTWGAFRWQNWLNISVYALTPAALIGMIFEPTTVPVYIAWLFHVTTAIIYTVMGAQRCVRNEPKR
jgi:hypothetical protein